MRVHERMGDFALLMLVTLLAGCVQGPADMEGLVCEPGGDCVSCAADDDCPESMRCSGIFAAWTQSCAESGWMGMEGEEAYSTDPGGDEYVRFLCAHNTRLYPYCVSDERAPEPAVDCDGVVCESGQMCVFVPDFIRGPQGQSLEPGAHCWPDTHVDLFDCEQNACDGVCGDFIPSSFHLIEPACVSGF